MQAHSSQLLGQKKSCVPLTHQEQVNEFCSGGHTLYLENVNIELNRTELSYFSVNKQKPRQNNVLRCLL